MGALTADAGAGDVIAALATPPGVSAVAVIRLSGPAGEARRVASRVAPALSRAVVPREMSRSALLDAAGRSVDEGLVVLFESPRSATGEEVVELHAHGSPAI